MVRSFCLIPFLAGSLVLSSQAQTPAAAAPDPQQLLQRALALADLYNWADAAPLFAEAQKQFERAGDERNALHARLGFIRASIERQQATLPAVSHQLGIELTENPLLQQDKRLRLFALVVKGDIDAEVDTAAMTDDWQQVNALARELDDDRWVHRSKAQLGVAAYYNGDIETARRSLGEALAGASQVKDVGGQIRALTIIGRGFAETKDYAQALNSLEAALQLAAAIPDSGSPFSTQEVRIAALMGSGQIDAARQR